MYFIQALPNFKPSFLKDAVLLAVCCSPSCKMLLDTKNVSRLVGNDRMLFWCIEVMITLFLYCFYMLMCSAADSLTSIKARLLSDFYEKLDGNEIFLLVDV